MRDRIRKILKESDFDWINDIQYIKLGWGEKPKVGEKLVCLGGYSNSTEIFGDFGEFGEEDVCDEFSGGYGYVPNRIITVKRATNVGYEECPNRIVVWPELCDKYRSNPDIQDYGIFSDVLARKIVK